ncbi:MAG: DUF935 family protein [bacterium]|nr:DUF935 family protein [bacterium]
MSLLYDANGNPVVMPPRPPSGRAGRVPLAHRNWGMLGQFDSPAKIRAALQSARSGNLRTLMALAEEIERDPRFGGLLRKRRLAVTGKQTRVEAADESPLAQTIAKSVEAMMARLDLRRAIRHFQDARLKPLAACEIIWRNTLTATEPMALVPRLGTEFTFDYQKSDEQLRLITDANNLQGDPIDPLKFVVVYSTEHGETLKAKNGLVWGCAGRWLMRNLLWMDWLASCERWGDPSVFGKYPQGTPDEQIAALEEAVQAIATDGAGVIPSDMLIEIVQTAHSAGGKTLFEGAMLFLEREISIAITGETLTSQGSDLGKGTMALGEVHEGIRQELVEADAVEIGEAISEQLIKPYVIFNWGEQPGYPKLAIVTDPETDLQAELLMDERLQRMGFQFSQAYFEEKYGRPGTADGEEPMRPISPATFFDWNLNPGTADDYGLPISPDKTTPMSLARNHPPLPPHRVEGRQKDSGRARTPASANDIPPASGGEKHPFGWPPLMGANNMPGQVQTDSEIEERIREAKRVYGVRGLELLEKIRAAGDASDFETLTAITPADFVTDLSESLQRGSAAGMEFGRRETKKSRKQKAESGSHPPQPPHRVEGSRAGKWAEVEDYGGSNIELDFFRMRSFTIAHVEDQRILDELKSEIAKTLEGGGTFVDFRTKAEDILGNILSDERARTVYSTNLHTAYNAGKFYEGMDAQEELPYWEYVTVEDDDVRPAHAAMHGFVARKDDPIWNEWLPPNGYNCRCTVVEHDDFSLQAEGKKVSTTRPKLDDGSPANPDIGFNTNAALDPSVIEALRSQYQIAEKLFSDYGLKELKAASEPKTKADLTEGIPDEQGRTRMISEAVLARFADQGGLISQTLSDPMEIWGWPERELYYIASYETAERGVQSVIVKVWGDVTDAEIVAGSADRFRKGMLVFRKN